MMVHPPADVHRAAPIRFLWKYFPIKVREQLHSRNKDFKIIKDLEISIKVTVFVYIKAFHTISWCISTLQVCAPQNAGVFQRSLQGQKIHGLTQICFFIGTHQVLIFPGRFHGTWLRLTCFLAM